MKNTGNLNKTHLTKLKKNQQQQNKWTLRKSNLVSLFFLVNFQIVGKETSSNPNIGLSILMGVGATIMILGIMGCCSALAEHRFALFVVSLSGKSLFSDIRLWRNFFLCPEYLSRWKNLLTCHQKFSL